MSSLKKTKNELKLSKSSEIENALNFNPKQSQNTNLENDNNSDDLNKSGSDIEINVTTYPLKITFIGNSNVGKSSIIKRYIENKFEENSIAATINASYHTKKIMVDAFSEADLNIWDTAGQERFRSTTKNYFHDSNGILIVFDLTDEKSFKDLDCWMEEVTDSAPEKCAKILVGNKTDLENKKITYENAKKYAENHNIQYQEVSAKSGINIELLFSKIGAECIKIIQEEQKNNEEGEESGKNEKGQRISALSGQFENNINNDKIFMPPKDDKYQKSKTACC